MLAWIRAKSTVIKKIRKRGEKVLGTCFRLGELLLFATAIQHVGCWLPVRIFFALIRPTLYRNDCSCLLRSLMRRLRNTESINLSHFFRLGGGCDGWTVEGFAAVWMGIVAPVELTLLSVYCSWWVMGWLGVEGDQKNQLSGTSKNRLSFSIYEQVCLSLIKLQLVTQTIHTPQPINSPNFFPIVFYRLQIPQNDGISRWLCFSNFKLNWFV